MTLLWRLWSLADNGSETGEEYYPRFYEMLTIGPDDSFASDEPSQLPPNDMLAKNVAGMIDVLKCFRI